jgi:hypothetical protein
LMVHQSIVSVTQLLVHVCWWFISILSLLHKYCPRKLIVRQSIVSRDNTLTNHQLTWTSICVTLTNHQLTWTSICVTYCLCNTTTCTPKLMVRQSIVSVTQLLVHVSWWFVNVLSL